jgi:hypothetical protein
MWVETLDGNSSSLDIGNVKMLGKMVKMYH